MTPAASAAAARSHARRAARGAALPRPVAPRGPRRVSGPLRPASRRGGAPPLAPPLAARLLQGAGQIVDHRLLDRLIRGRAWIGLVTFALIGIVAMQVTLLKLNTGISRSIERVATLQHEQTALQAQLSALATGDRVLTAAAQQGMVYDPAGDVRYLDVAASDALRASRALRAGLAEPLSPAALTAAAAAAAGSGADAATGTLTATAGSAGAPAPASTPSAPASTPSAPASTPSAPATMTQPHGAARSNATAAPQSALRRRAPRSTAAPQSSAAGSQTAPFARAPSSSGAAGAGAGSAATGGAGGTATDTTSSSGGGSAAGAAGAASYPGGGGRGQ